MFKGTKSAVFLALTGDICVTIFKFIAAFLSGSTAMLAEAYHSISDTMNQVLLLVGLKRSQLPPTKLHPYGHGKEQFFWAFVVSMMLFSIAGVLSIRDGITKIRNPEPLSALGLTFAVLAVSFVFELVTLLFASKQLKYEMKKEKLEGIFAAIKHSKNPTLLTVIMQDSVALLSIVVATIGIGMSEYTHNSVYDGVASVVIGILLMAFALLLASEIKHLLIGESISKYQRKKIITAIDRIAAVNAIIDFRTMHLGPEEILVTMEVNLKDNLVTNDAEKVIDQIEREVHKILPRARVYVELEHVPEKRKRDAKAELFK